MNGKRERERKLFQIPDDRWYQGEKKICGDQENCRRENLKLNEYYYFNILYSHINLFMLFFSYVPQCKCTKDPIFLFYTFNKYTRFIVLLLFTTAVIIVNIFSCTISYCSHKIIIFLILNVSLTSEALWLHFY